jgi:hypothetical protein
MKKTSKSSNKGRINSKKISKRNIDCEKKLIKDDTDSEQLCIPPDNVMIFQLSFREWVESYDYKWYQRISHRDSYPLKQLAEFFEDYPNTPVESFDAFEQGLRENADFKTAFDDWFDDWLKSEEPEFNCIKLKREHFNEGDMMQFLENFEYAVNFNVTDLFRNLDKPVLILEEEEYELTAKNFDKDLSLTNIEEGDDFNKFKKKLGQFLSNKEFNELLEGTQDEKLLEAVGQFGTFVTVKDVLNALTKGESITGDAVVVVHSNIYGINYVALEEDKTRGEIEIPLDKVKIDHGDYSLGQKMSYYDDVDWIYSDDY